MTGGLGDLSAEDRRILYATTELGESIARALRDGLDAESCFMALILAASELLSDVPPESRDPLIRLALSAALGGN